MRIFDRIDPTTLDRRELQLWLLAITIILVLSTGMALLMYPTVFSQTVVLSGTTMRKVFFGFCGLSVLLIGYLIDRQVVIGQLRKRLEEEQRTILRIRQEASSDLLETLPRIDHFRDRLAMEYRRASNTQQPLSLLVVDLKPSRNLSGTPEASTAFGDAAKTLTRKLRGEDSIYLFGPGSFGIVLPGVDANNALRVVDRLKEGLLDASGASDRFSFEVRVVSYPEHVTTAREMEGAAMSCVPQNRSDPNVVP